MGANILSRDPFNVILGKFEQNSIQIKNNGKSFRRMDIPIQGHRSPIFNLIVAENEIENCYW